MGNTIKPNDEVIEHFIGEQLAAGTYKKTNFSAEWKNSKDQLVVVLDPNTDDASLVALAHGTLAQSLQFIDNPEVEFGRVACVTW